MDNELASVGNRGVQNSSGNALSTSERLAIVVGCVVSLLGIVVLFGWYTNSPRLIRVYSEFAPMQYNTALGFLLSGVALIALALRASRLATLIGASVGAIGLLTASQYVFGLSLGIDNLLMEPYITAQSSGPGRMAPGTALCVVKFFQPRTKDVTTVLGQGEVLTLQGELIPMLRVSRILGIPSACEDCSEGLVVVVDYDGRKYGLLVDDLLGLQQIVIKPLGRYMLGTPGYSGGAIMPDGNVSLIIDVGSLIELASNSPTESESSNRSGVTVDIQKKVSDFETVQVS